MKQQSKTYNQGIKELIVQGLVVRLTFAEQANQAVPSLVREILKKSYLQRNAGYCPGFVHTGS